MEMDPNSGIFYRSMALGSDDTEPMKERLRSILDSKESLERADGDEALRLMTDFPEITTELFPLMGQLHLLGPNVSVSDTGIVKRGLGFFLSLNGSGIQIEIEAMDTRFVVTVGKGRLGFCFPQNVPSSVIEYMKEILSEHAQDIEKCTLNIVPSMVGDEQIETILDIYQGVCQQMTKLVNFRFGMWGTLSNPDSKARALSNLLVTLLEQGTVSSFVCLGCPVLLDDKLRASVVKNTSLTSVSFYNLSAGSEDEAFLKHHALLNTLGKKQVRDNDISLTEIVNLLAQVAVSSQTSLQEALIFSLLRDCVATWSQDDINGGRNFQVRTIHDPPPKKKQRV